MVIASTMRGPGRARAGCAALIAAALLIVGSPARAADAEVTIDNFTFSPQTLTIKAGSKVTWTNRDDIPHTVASTAKAFKSPALDTDDSYSFTFTTAGSYEYFCSLHPHMTGTIVVQAAAGPAPSQ
ncbi:MAG TPA: cupredoxin family copper-binding protein [Xanthobacteraceae bacterium]|jgi:amicyanin|nr:cupredoxin family copper-binding protein [Xanthobacteraceae bacterium]